ncbi:hypothetical protein TrCOL_g5613 [Triparma columacea]|uniref:Uncharacterized protein n=1 Tax=Triparma columacea TaxID=722753 RepID=A0A9W7L8R8_9STRA|nr:hypothetical protein TrCOL_g5613 [Triparma columacea]
MRGAGCTLNDILDRDIDGSVARTSTRPLPNGDVTTTQAVGWLGLQMSVGLGVLVSLPHTFETVKMGLATVPLFLLYPTAKRWTDKPQYVLGLMINSGTLLGPTIATGTFQPSLAVPLYLGFASWTVVYDTIYAHQDKGDDKKLGLGSTALAYGDDGTRWRLMLGTALFGIGMITAGFGAGLEGNGMFIWTAGTGVATGMTGMIVRESEWGNKEKLGRDFRKFGGIGGIVTASSAAALAVGMV